MGRHTQDKIMNQLLYVLLLLLLLLVLLLLYSVLNKYLHAENSFISNFVHLHV
jgi:hypothetical protein